MMLESEQVWQQASRELLRAIRGKRSQVAFSRWLGYRGNVAASWEGGHRAPTAETLIRAMERVGIDVQAGFRAFHEDSAKLIARGLAAWLRGLQGQTRQAMIARRSGFSRHQVRRWLTGQAVPRVPQFLRLVHALTGRGPDWVASFVDISQVPALAAHHAAARTAATLAFDDPWAAAVRMVIDSDVYRADPSDEVLRRTLGLSQEALEHAVDALLHAGLAERTSDGLRSLSTFSADTRASTEDRRRLKAHWAQVAADRLREPHAEDLVSFNLAILSRRDLERVQQLQREYFRALRGLVASSTPEETAVLVMMHCVSLTPSEG